MIRVTVDDRERNQVLLGHLAGAEGVRVERARLPCGDYRWESRLLIERKTVRDLVVSLCDGRLFRQVHRLKNASPTPCLLIEGGWATIARMAMDPAAIRGAVVNVALVQGVPILHARGPAESARTMLMATRQIADAGRIRRLPPRYTGDRNEAKHRIQRYVLEGIPGIGPGRADARLERFGNLEAIFAAEDEEWREVPGMGSATVGRMRWAVSAPGSYYNAQDQCCATFGDPAPYGSRREPMP